MLLVFYSSHLATTTLTASLPILVKGKTTQLQIQIWMTTLKTVLKLLLIDLAQISTHPAIAESHMTEMTS